MPEIHWMAVLGTVITNMIIGMLWFGPLLGKQWMRSAGITKERIENSNKMRPMIVALCGSVFTAIVFSVMTDKMGVNSMRGYVESAAWLWFGFFATMSFVNHMYRDSSRLLWKIEAGYWLMTSIAMALVFAFVLV